MFNRENAEMIAINIPSLVREICLKNEDYQYVPVKSEIMNHKGTYYVGVNMDQFNKTPSETPATAIFELPPTDDKRILDKAVKRPQNLYTAVRICGDKDEELFVVCYYTDGSDADGNEGLMHELMLDYLKTFDIEDMPSFIGHFKQRLDDYNSKTGEQLTTYKVFPDYKKFMS